MNTASTEFRKRVRMALADDELQHAMGRAKGGFVLNRQKAIAEFPEFHQMTDAARDIKDHVLMNLDLYLEIYEKKVLENGGQVHWARTAEEASTIVEGLCRRSGARKITKGKSMVSEEINLNEKLEKSGMQVIETDLGEYIVQLASEKPSHIIAPAVHKTRNQISKLFYKHHKPMGYADKVSERKEIVQQARSVLRNHFVESDIGITGANFLIAETGSSVIVTNEGNGDLTSVLPRMQIVVAGIEKVIPSLEDLSVFLRVLARSATGQEISAYTSLYSGPRANHADEEGPEQYHVVLVDNGRSSMLGSEYQSMLRCIRCGACLNHCTVYNVIGGHAYGSIYPGPMGSVLTPLIDGHENNTDLANACTLNGLCRTICPVHIPLPDLLRNHRTQQQRRKLTPFTGRFFFAIWVYLVRRPHFYQIVLALPIWVLNRVGRKSGVIKRIPLANGWTNSRDFPCPSAQTFQRQWRAEMRKFNA
ncbi:MAG: iron-sulfur cluster-binding protein [Acidiferrobacteraceae bacterium]|nr:iron-sulfur cluster-binding protein [Acidiferrobacteraceae bacterium]